MAMTAEQKKEERGKLLALFANKKTTVDELFQYLNDFKLAHPDDLRENSPFKGPNNQKDEQRFEEADYLATIEGEKIHVSVKDFASLDRMIECLPYDPSDLETYIMLRWDNAKDSKTTFGRNTGTDKIPRDALNLQYNGLISGSTILTDAATMISSKLNKKDQEFWETVLKIRTHFEPAPTIPVPPKGEDVMKIISDAIKNSAKKCVVFTGAPGTGKTYCVEEYVKKEYIKQRIKGLLKTGNGIKEYIKKEEYVDLVKELVEKDEDVEEYVKEESIKELEKKKGEYFVQFHSSYDYTDFVEGLRPIQKEGEDGKKGEMEFVRMDGIFKAFCRKVVALNEKTEGEKPNYYFIIDEINRADLGRVFGELMYCFEKRGKSVATQYANLPAYGKDEVKEEIVRIKDGLSIRDEKGDPVPITDDCFKDGFYIPHNVVIIGTMNDIDRSVETFDFALRRRFDWIEIEADKVMKSSLTSMGVPVGIVDEVLSDIKAMNSEIADKKNGLGKDFKIGPAYFKDLKALKDHDVTKKPEKTLEEARKEALAAIWKHNIEPILREYVRGRQDPDKFVGACRDKLHVPKEPEGEQ